MAKYYVEVNEHGTFWYKDEEMTVRHRDHGPAREFADGEKHWYIDGKLHREDGPAYENDNGHKVWWINGKCHREDGPAVEYSNGQVEYWLDHVQMTKAEWEAATRPPEEMTVAQIEKLLGKRIKVVK